MRTATTSPGRGTSMSASSGSRWAWRTRYSTSAHQPIRPPQIVIPPPGMDDPQPRFGVDVGDAAAVDAAHAEALRRGLSVVYPLTDEPWGIRRFFVEDPGGTVVSGLAHIDADA